MNKYIATFSLFMLSLITAAGQSQNTENAPASDKFFVVGIVLAIIFTGLAIYLFILDRKVSKLEKQHREKKEK